MSTINTKIIFLKGTKADLPEQLDTGELAMTTDDGTLVIGSDPRFGQANIDREEFPYRNVEILTERSEETFAKMHGDRMREGLESDYYECRLEPDRLGWTPVLIDNDGEYTPYRIEILFSVSAFIDYTVTENELGEPIRDGQLIVWQHDTMGNINRAQFTDKSSMPRERNLTNPSNYDPRQVFEKVKFRFRISDDNRFLEFEYKNYTFDFLCLQFRVSRPLDGGVKNVLRANVIISAELLGEAADPPVLAAPMLFKTGGYDNLDIQDGDDTHTDNLGTLSMIKVDDQGNIYMVGAGVLPLNIHSVIVKYSPTGDFIWQRGFSQSTDNAEYLSNAFYGLEIDADGNILCVGSLQRSIDSNLIYGKDVGLLVKFDPLGNEIFRRVYVDFNQSRDHSVRFNEVVSTPDAIFVTGVMSLDFGNNFNVDRAFAARLDAVTGAVVWFNEIKSNAESGTGYNVATNNIKMDSAGNLLQMGRVDYNALLLRKFSPDGILIFSKVFRHHDYAEYEEAQFTVGPDDYIYVTEPDPDFYNTVLVSKFTPTGEKVWQKGHGYINEDAYFGQPHTVVTDSVIYVLVQAKPMDGERLMVMELDLNGVFQRIRYCAVSSFGNSYNGFEFTSVDMRNGHFYVGFNELNFYIDTRARAKGILVMPVAWDGVEVLDYEGELYVRPPRINSLETMTAFNVDRTVELIYIEDPVGEYGLGSTTGIEIELISSGFVSYKTDIDDALSPQAIVGPVLGYSIENVVADQDFWALRTQQTETDFTGASANYLLLYPYQTAVDSAGNIYTMGWYQSSGTYTVVNNIDKLYLQKVSSDGVVEWIKTITTPVTYYWVFGFIAVDETGIYIVVNGVSGGWDIAAIKVALDGSSILWHKKIEGADANTTYWATDLQARGSNVEVVSFNYTGGNIPQVAYTMRLDRTTGNIANAVSYTAPVQSGGMYSTRRLYDGAGHYYEIHYHQYSQPTIFAYDYTYILSKHLVSDDSIVWQRRGRATPTRYRTDIVSDFTLDPVTGDIYVSAIIQDLLSLGGRPRTRRLMVKYAPNGTMVAHKIYRVTTSYDKVLYRIGAPKCVWFGDRILSCSTTSHGVMIDAFDLDLNPLWGKTIYTMGQYTSGEITKLNDNSAVFVSKNYNEEPAQFLFRIPIDGDFKVPSNSGLFFYPLTYAEATTFTSISGGSPVETTYAFIDEVSTHIQSVADHTTVPLVTTITTSTIANYPHAVNYRYPPSP